MFTIWSKLRSFFTEIFVSTSGRIGTRERKHFRFSYQQVYHEYFSSKVACRKHLLLQYLHSTPSLCPDGQSRLFTILAQPMYHYTGPKALWFCIQTGVPKTPKTRPNVTTGASVCPPTIYSSYTPFLHIIQCKTRTHGGTLREWVRLNVTFPCHINGCLYAGVRVYAQKRVLWGSCFGMLQCHLIFSRMQHKATVVLVASFLRITPPPRYTSLFHVSREVCTSTFVMFR